jgi:hypothetical protein
VTTAACILAAGLDASTTGVPMVGDDAVRVHAAVEAIRTRLGDVRLEQRWAEGAALGDDEVLAFARRQVSATDGEV